MSEDITVIQLIMLIVSLILIPIVGFFLRSLMVKFNEAVEKLNKLQLDISKVENFIDGTIEMRFKSIENEVGKYNKDLAQAKIDVQRNTNRIFKLELDKS